MLSIAKCRAYLKDYDLTDEQIARLRDILYQAASILIEEYVKNKLVKQQKPLKSN